MRPDFKTLEAVNRMLRAADEQSVNSLDNDGVNDTELAQDILEQTIMQVLARGWVFNTDITTLSPDTNGFISIARDILRVDGAGDDYHCNFAIRSGKLYDRDNSTNVFTSSVEVEVVRWFAFDNLPLEMRYYIADISARQYQQDTMNDPNRDRVLAEKELMSKNNLTASELKQRDAVWGGSKNSSARLIRNRKLRSRRG